MNNHDTDTNNDNNSIHCLFGFSFANYPDSVQRWLKCLYIFWLSQLQALSPFSFLSLPALAMSRGGLRVWGRSGCYPAGSFHACRGVGLGVVASAGHVPEDSLLLTTDKVLIIRQEECVSHFGSSESREELEQRIWLTACKAHFTSFQTVSHSNFMNAGRTTASPTTGLCNIAITACARSSQARICRFAVCVCVCVCVWTIWIDVKLLICRGPPGSRGGRWPMKTPPRDPCKRTCKQWPWTANPFGGGRSWALLWQSLGAVVRSWDVTIYIYKSFLLGLTVLSLHVRCFPHQQFDKTFLSKCVTHAGSVKVVWALRGKPFQANCGQ